MNVSFQSSQISYLKAVLSQTEHTEQTQEIRLTDDLPDIGRIQGAWGQVITRGKEWRSDSMLYSGGVMVWVLYAPEDGTALRRLETWIPFQTKWDMQTHGNEGKILIDPICRFVDARSVSPRKIMLRVGVSVRAEAYCTEKTEVSHGEHTEDTVELLTQRYPVRLRQECGEKVFQAEEEFAADAAPTQLVYYTVKAETADQKVLSDKVAFRGNCQIHLLYLDTAGQLHAQNAALPFSQFAELSGMYGNDAGVDVTIVPTNLEVRIQEDQSFRVQCSLAAQFLVDDVSMIEIVEDAYALHGLLTPVSAPLELPAILEKKSDCLHAEASVQEDVFQIVDASYFPDFPTCYLNGDSVALEAAGSVQILYLDKENAVRSLNLRLPGKTEVAVGEQVQMQVYPKLIPEPSVRIGEGGITVSTDLPLNLISVSGSEIPMVTGYSLEEQKETGNKPSLILRRVRDETLWEIAKSCSSTVSAIQNINGIEAAASGQMLLIPVK